MRQRKRAKSRKTTRKSGAGKSVKAASDSTGNWNRRHVGGLLAVVVISAVVNCTGLGWGRSGLVPWQPDSIEGVTTVREMPRMFGQWTYKYPRGHFLINAVFYHPLLKYWEKHSFKARTADGRIVSQALNLERLDQLANISRVISALMGVGTVLAVFFASRLLFEDYLGAFLAGLALALSQLFVFYSHVGNVDVPSIFWFAWGVYWAVKAVYIGRWRHFVLMGLCFSLSICTKDAMVGYVAGMVPAFWLAMIGKSRADGQSFKTAVLSVFSKKVLVAVLVFLFFYALLQDILTSPQAFAQRMSHWIGGPGVKGYDKRFRGQLPLLWSACRTLYGSFGWPLLAFIVISLVYCAIKYPWQSVFLTVPLIAFYVIVVMNIRFSVPRFFLPAYGGFASLVGKGCADWIRYKKIHFTLRILPVAVVYSLSLLYCVGLDLEMLADTRVRTEQWFYKNVGRDSLIGVGFHNKLYAPRLHFNGYRLICPWRISTVRGTSGGSQPYPDYLIITPGWIRIKEKAEDDFRKKLFDGQTNYKKVISFKAKYLYPARTIFGFAGWPTQKNGFLSPEIIVFKKK
jgi:hypothetical protein